MGYEAPHREAPLAIDLADLPPLADEGTLAAALGIRPSTLRRWRSTGQGPRYTKVGWLVRYPRPEVKRWLEAGGGP